MGILTKLYGDSLKVSLSVRTKLMNSSRTPGNLTDALTLTKHIQQTCLASLCLNFENMSQSLVQHVETNRKQADHDEERRRRTIYGAPQPDPLNIY